MRPRIPLPPSLRSGPFLARDGLDAGIGRNRMRGPDLHAPFHGVRILAAPSIGLVELCLAYQRHMREDAFFCGPTAAELMGVPLPGPLGRPHPLHIAVPAPSHAPAGKGVVGHSVRPMGNDARLWNDLRISSPARVWCELGATLSLEDLVAAGDYLAHWQHPLASIQNLREAVGRYPGRRGKPKLHLALDYLDDRSESPQESRLRVICVRGGIRGLKANLPVTTSGGFRYRADLAIPARRLILEYQSSYHGEDAQFRADMTRRGRLEADGWVVMLINADDLRNPAELLRRIRQTLLSRPHFA